MKLTRLTLYFALLLVVGACQKNDTSVSTTVSNAEAAEMVSSALAVNSNGFVNLSSSDISVNAQAMIDLSLACGATKTYSVARQSPSGAATSYSYAIAYNYTLNCNSSNIPDNITGGLTNSGKFESATLASTNTGTATFRIAGLTPAATGYVINGEYKLNGTFQSKVGDKNYTTSAVDINITNLIINKATKAVTGGTATVTAIGSTTKTNFSYTGSLTFSGGIGTLTLNGTNYSIDLTTGVVTKKA